ncbi:N-acetylmuramic acid 6-phosphate etherase [Gluconobacter sphaericus]|uniref:N-acetylmuramic acid 6-phosphate etherase n=1 Tax=Gluconobacter sphaericus NBRC 12467 TaxID=1307951 RepID=A0AA37WB63_9PROT|nr:N-acetylmuramic acid 6-phosphate etherase [Gluconobacter sphaericus]MBF0886239.1 N-acetylmuramic acid 6-phosphate etherase [Gluconobacter sphaericus]GBR50194.1 N-acetylmuramic acid 6-phosphate etherase [Gluconobacter sphaericus NBRC 12467]GEB43307.1 N-acetylmuramic acid 6-phosphate etherase [Gluconobacter sphaericus NBRC 12467]GLQ86345.1 N-acetylmuramic acid 6-phosphate etherase [Gluconobacter sphaericus NBRC 12467]
MTNSRTETVLAANEDIEHLPLDALLERLLTSQKAALDQVGEALPSIERAVEAAVPRLQAGGRLVYAGAGTSGRIGLQDGVELTPTFGVAPEKLVLLLAGGAGATTQAAEGAEDREDQARLDLLDHHPTERDVVIGVAASGNTPYTCAVVQLGREVGALTIGVSGNPDSRLLREAEFGICIPTGAEVLAGSTRMAAGTAQKVTLNLFSTALMTRLGHVYRGRMVDMRISNDKLQARAERMVMELAGGTAEEAREALKRVRGNTKRAVLLRHGVALAEIEPLLERCQGNLHLALAGL